MREKWVGYRKPNSSLIPPDWTAVRIRDVASFKAGGSLGLTMADYKPEGTPAYTAEGQNGFAAVTEFDTKAVIVSSIGALCGKSFYNDGPFTTLANIQVIFGDEEKVSNYFLWCLLNDRAYWAPYQTAQPFIRPSDIQKSWIPLPATREEQTRIAETLKAANDHIRSVEAQLLKAKNLKKAMVEQGTTIGLRANAKTKHSKRYGHDFPTNATWEQVELRTLKPLIDYGTNQSSNDQKAGNPVIAIPQVLTSRFALGELPFAEVPDQERDSLALKPHDVLVVRTNGNPSYIGRSTVIPEGVLDRVTIFASYLIRIRLDETRLRGAFLNYVLLSQTGRRQSTCLANTSAGNFNLGARSLSKFLIPLPKPEEQDEIIEAINGADDLVLDLQNQLTAARRVKQSLLQNLLTGKIRLKA